MMPDTFDFDFRPVTRRRSGGLARMAGMLACAGSLGSPESQSQSAENQQTTVQGATGATTVALGAGSQGQVTVNTLDASVANSAISAEATTANNALEANNAGLSALLTAESGTANHFTDSVNALGAETLNFAGSTIGAIETSNANLQAQNQQTISHLADNLSAITANAAPQTQAAQNELLAGTTPTGAAAAKGTDWATVIGIVAGILALTAFLKSKGANT